MGKCLSYLAFGVFTSFLGSVLYNITNPNNLIPSNQAVRPGPNVTVNLVVSEDRPKASWITKNPGRSYESGANRNRFENRDFESPAKQYRENGRQYHDSQVNELRDSAMLFR